jgi:phosphatidylglycerol:prolipoprotein diacylglycerol transferase
VFPKIISFGDFFLPAYGVLVALGFLAGLAVTLKLARRAGLDAEKIGNLAVYCALTGLAGAKLLMFVFDFNYYSTHPEKIFSLETLLSAGVYYGGFLAALGFAWFYVRRERLPWLAVADALAPGVALGHTVGRLGCFAAGCCWGTECDRPWAVTFTSADAHALTGVPLGVKLHPAQLYEAALTLAVFWVVYRKAMRPHEAGSVLGWYLVLYSAARIGVEFVRAHEQALPFGGPLSTTQWIAVGLLGGGLWLLNGKRRRAGRGQ